MDVATEKRVREASVVAPDDWLVSGWLLTWMGRCG
jgi:hypothetical protein